MKIRNILFRYSLFLVGLFIASLGVAFSTKAGLGTSPVASVPYSISLLSTLFTFGGWLNVWSVIQILIQIAILRKNCKWVEIIIQTALAFLYGYLTNFSCYLLKGIAVTNYAQQFGFMMAGCFVLALGLWIQFKGGVAMLPGEAMNRAISSVTGKKYENVKVFFDVLYIVVSVIICLIFLKGLKGVREGSIIAAVLIGNIIKVYNFIWNKIIPHKNKEKQMDATVPQNFKTNPIITSIYTADPAPMVSGDTLYLFTTHDEDKLINDFYTMFDWRCYSTKDMVNWTDHGVIFSLDDITWAEDRAWAPQCCERNGKFYLYCPVHKKNGGMAIAVGVADKPEGPYKDLGYPLIDEGDWNDIDPTVFIDDDGQAYLYFGNPELRYVLLNEDMISYNKEAGIQKIPMTVEAFSKGSHNTGTSYGEGPWFYKRNNLYYMVYAAFAEGEKRNEHLAYSTSKSPTGPWTYGGVLMEEGPCFTNHPGIADFKGRSYLFYHNDQLPGGSLFHRSVCVAEFKYNEDGSIDTIKMCDKVDGIQD